MAVPRTDCVGVGIDRSDNDELMANNAGVRTNAKRANEMHKGTKDLALSWIMIISLISRRTSKSVARRELGVQSEVNQRRYPPWPPLSSASCASLRSSAIRASISLNGRSHVLRKNPNTLPSVPIISYPHELGMTASERLRSSIIPGNSRLICSNVFNDQGDEPCCPSRNAITTLG